MPLIVKTQSLSLDALWAVEKEQSIYSESYAEYRRDNAFFDEVKMVPVTCTSF
jgi:hypothetical protein